MVIACGLELLSLKENCARIAFLNNADPDARNAGSWRRGVEQFVIFAVVQSLFQCRAFEQRNFVQRRGDLRCHAETVQIDGETIADVHAGMGLAQQLFAFIETGRKSGTIAPAAQRSRNINRIAWFCAIAA